MKSGDTSLGGPARGFPATVWEDLRHAQSATPDTRRKALGELCGRYWKPIYRHLRIAWAKSNEDAKELTQAFLLWLIEGDALERYQPGRASFRTYLKSLLRHFIQHHDEALHRLKRGGGIDICSLQDGDSPMADALEDPRRIDPEEAFDRAWRAALLAAALSRVRERLSQDGTAGRIRLGVFEAYDLVSPPERPTHATLAERFGIKVTDVQNYLFAVREEMRSELRAEIARTSADEASLKDEWNGFFDPR